MYDFPHVHSPTSLCPPFRPSSLLPLFLCPPLHLSLLCLAFRLRHDRHDFKKGHADPARGPHRTPPFDQRGHRSNRRRRCGGALAARAIIIPLRSSDQSRQRSRT